MMYLASDKIPPPCIGQHAWQGALTIRAFPAATRVLELPHGSARLHAEPIYCSCHSSLGANAFGSIARRWIDRCLVLSGASPALLAFFRNLLRPSTLFFDWKRSGEVVLSMVEGTPQGGPLSPFLFLLGVDPLLRCLALPLTPNEL
eukprot:4383158-Amphidinium_carterae.1